MSDIHLKGRGREWTGGYRTAELLELISPLYDEMRLSDGGIFYSEKRFSERSSPHYVWRQVENISIGTQTAANMPDYETAFFHFLGTQIPDLTRDLGKVLMLSGVPVGEIEKIQREIIGKLNRFHEDSIITPTKSDLERLVALPIPT